MKFEPKDFEIIEPIIKKTIDEYFIEKEKRDFEKQIFTVTQVKTMLGKSYNWVKSKIKDRTLKTTSDGEHISGKELNRYLGQ